MIHRRQAIKASLATGAAFALTGCASSPRDTRHRSAATDSPELAAAVDAGRRYFAKRCDDQLPLVNALEAALRSGDIEAAKRAYVESRPPYEEIETHAGSFEASDRDIDARPYAFEGGETDAEFRGFHKIEALIYGYQDLDAALPYARGLVESVRSLRRELSDPTRFDAVSHFGGMIALATEVSAKKISSEEETWSDQTLLIFRHNWIGIFSQYEPFDKLVAAKDASVSRAVREAYTEAMALLADHFSSGSAAGTPYSKIQIPERRRMADASNRLRDSLVDASRVLDTEPV
ncbi:MAG: imelysin family protein [Planctomycetota bacterium]